MEKEMQKTTIDYARQLLGNCILFSGLSRDERAAIATRARIRSFGPGETIFTIGSPGNEIMAVLNGSIRISVPSADGKELLLAILGQGEFFGELAVFDGKERSADATGEHAGTLAVLDRQDILLFFERNPAAWRKLVDILCQRLRRTDQSFAEVALLQIPIRLAKTLLRLLQSQPGTGGAALPTIRFSQRELASMVGGTRESVNKCLRVWQRNGLVQVSEGYIVITDLTALDNLTAGF
jgi:CRP/FNR family cyclic AMP-dependent transcriptional regulator